MLKEIASKNVWSAPSAQDSCTWRRRQLRKCIRPLASGLRLQPGHDEIRAHRSQINGSCTGTLFCQSLRCADRLSRHPPRASQSLGRALLSDRGIASFVNGSVPANDHQAMRAIFAASATVTLLMCIRNCSWAIHAPSRSRDRSRWVTQDLAPWIRSLRTYRFPRLLIPSI